MSDWEPKIAAFLCNWCSYGAADLAGVEGWNTRPISGSSEFRAPVGWILNFSWRPCAKALTASGYPGDIRVNAITWKVITMPVANSPFSKI